MKAGRVLFLALAFFLLTTIRAADFVPDRGGPGQFRLFAVSVPLDSADLGRRRVGGLLYRRGWALSSDDIRFGGISALHVEGGRAVAVSDAGDLFEFALPGEAGGGRVQIRALPNERASDDKSSRDIEAMLVWGDKTWFAFENFNGVGRYRRSGWVAESVERPSLMRRWRRNGGPEAMVRLADGRFLIFAEGRASGPPLSQVALFSGDPAAPGTMVAELRYRRPEGYRVTDAALLPDGRLLILNRRFSWLSGVAAKLVVADIGRLRPGTVIEGEEVATLEPPLTVDNMEGLSVAREGGRTIVRIASDDNFMAIQRTLLLEFELTAPPSPRRRPGSRGDGQ